MSYILAACFVPATTVTTTTNYNFHNNNQQLQSD